MASLDILCSNSLNLKNKITKIEHRKIFYGPSKILKNISWSISICLKYFMTPTKALLPHPSFYILNVRSLNFHMFHLCSSHISAWIFAGTYFGLIFRDIRKLVFANNTHFCIRDACLEKKALESLTSKNFRLTWPCWDLLPR